jgi:hypothetical protein
MSLRQAFFDRFEPCEHAAVWRKTDRHNRQLKGERLNINRDID